MLRVVFANNYDNQCLYGKSHTCKDPQNFYDYWTDPNCWFRIIKANKTMSGLVISCFLVDSFLISFLKCSSNINRLMYYPQLSIHD